MRTSASCKFYARMRVFLVFSVQIGFSGDGKKRFDDQGNGQNRSSESDGEQKISGVKRCGAKQRAAEIQKRDLHDRDARHNKQKRFVISQPRQKIAAGGADVVAVEDAHKNEQRKEGGKGVYRMAVKHKAFSAWGQKEKGEADRDGVDAH